MARTNSAMVALGTPAPDFTLPEVVAGRRIGLADLRGRPALLVIFLCRHCPFVRHVESEIAQLGADFPAIGIVAISSNDAAAYPEDAPEELRAMALRLGLVFPVCYDETQAVARAFGAVCTPEFFLYDDDLRLVYHGQLDDSRPGNGIPVTGADLRAAIAALLAGGAVNPRQKPALGCGIKWKTPDGAR